MCVSCSSSFLPLFWDGCFIRVVLLIITALYTRVYQMHKIAVKSIGCVSTPGFEKKCEKCQLLLGKLTPINDIRSFFDDRITYFVFHEGKWVFRPHHACSMIWMLESEPRGYWLYESVDLIHRLSEGDFPEDIEKFPGAEVILSFGCGRRLLHE